MNITEKFALLNLLKALEGLSGNHTAADTDTKPAPKADSAPPGANTDKAEVKEMPNVMASVIERHERISNRVHYDATRGK